MNKEAIEHRNRLKILENIMGTTYYETGHLHIAISDAMEEYAQQQVKLFAIPVVVQQSELLFAFCTYLEETTNIKPFIHKDRIVDNFKGKL